MACFEDADCVVLEADEHIVTEVGERAVELAKDDACAAPPCTVLVQAGSYALDSTLDVSDVTLHGADTVGHALRVYDPSGAILAERTFTAPNDFLTIETAFGLEYRWFKYDGFDRYDYPETGEVNLDFESYDGNRFDYTGWYGMGSLQFIVWF